MFDVGFPVKVAAICADEIAEWQRTTHALREYVAELTERLRGYEHERSVFNFSDQVTSQRHLGSDEAWCTSECRKVCEKSVSSAAAPALAPTPSSAPSILEVERLLTTACDDTCFGYTCDTWSSSYTCDEMESTYACDCSGCECEMCDDTNNGATDPYGDGCEAYSENPSWCGSYDDSDFSSEGMCCICGGGLVCSDTSGGATDSDGDGCEAYPEHPSWCGEYDDSDFSSGQMCCACHGGLMCSDTNDGATDPYGDGCEAYYENPSSWCGAFDDSDFSSEQMCCACDGGGSICGNTNSGATDPYSDGCEMYSGNPSWCGEYDDSDFSSEQMCCACDGGLTPSATPTVSDGPTFSPAPTVSGFDVLTHDQLSDAVDNAPDNGRQWAITIVTNVIAVESALFLRTGTNIKIMGDSTLGQRARVRPAQSYSGSFLDGRVRCDNRVHVIHTISRSSFTFFVRGQDGFVTVMLDDLQIKGFNEEALIIGPNATVTVQNCLFAENDEGAVWLLGPYSYLRIQSSGFFDNYASLYGAAVYVGNGQSEYNILEVADSEFARNYADFHGGVFYLSLDNHLDMRNCSLHDNWAWSDGGVIDFEGGTSAKASLTVRSSKFHNNTAFHGDGGAIMAGDLAQLHLERTIFVRNKAGDNAGAVALASESIAWIDNSVFHRNIAERGGALDASGARLDVVESNFTENSAMTDGGAVHAEDACTMDLRGATRFYGNFALNGRGGAISLVTSSLQTDESMLIFSTNTARLGGAISADEESSLRVYAGCQTTTFEMHWSNSPQSSLDEWAVVRRTGNGTKLEPSMITDHRGEWMILEPTAQQDTSVSFCLYPGDYEIMGAEGYSCSDGWGGGYVRVVDRDGAELAILTLEVGDGCSTKVSFSIAVDELLTNATSTVPFENNIAKGTANGFCGTGCGGAVYIGTVCCRAR